MRDILHVRFMQGCTKPPTEWEPPAARLGGSFVSASRLRYCVDLAERFQRVPVEHSPRGADRLAALLCWTCRRRKIRHRATSPCPRWSFILQVLFPTSPQQQETQRPQRAHRLTRLLRSYCRKQRIEPRHGSVTKRDLSRRHTASGHHPAHADKLREQRIGRCRWRAHMPRQPHLAARLPPAPALARAVAAYNSRCRARLRSSSISRSRNI